MGLPVGAPMRLLASIYVLSNNFISEVLVKQLGYVVSRDLNKLSVITSDLGVSLGEEQS
jgi:hypothetical protein